MTVWDRGVIQMRRRIALAPALFLTAACSLFDDGPRDRYVLTHMTNQPLPAVVRSITVKTADGLHQVDFRVARGILNLYRGSRFDIDSDLEEVWDGTVKSVSQRAPDRGSYERSDTAITIRFRDIDDVNQVFTYRLLDGGQRIRGEQWGLIAEYRRQ
jgi:hypothetical protein